MVAAFRYTLALAALVGPALAQPAPPLRSDYGTVTAGGSAQLLFGGARPLLGWEVCNPDVSRDLWVSDAATASANAAGSYRVPANGGCYVTPTTNTPNALGSVSLFGAGTGQPYTARRW